ncbi:CvpA family protein [Fodinibius sediminis]|uniref:Membrane protein required for colicin V production n=1 Tax=Fodinibius sediminis TaxID=1214077 RepID=A0A521BEK2_9BACT|nr:CvpA family protein [Fodinibius sediminis]SMO45516.1 membrane protein required for colicin V production [Fodinibius sediminis]
MNILDLLIVLPILFFAYRGFKNGLIEEVLSIAGIILGVFLTFRYMEEAGTYIQPFFEGNSEYVPFVAAFIIFIGTLIAVNLVAYISKKMLQTIHLNFINRASGLAFGALKCGVIISAVLLMAAGFNMPSQEVRKESISYGYVVYLAPWAYDTVASVYPGAENFTETVEKTIDQHSLINNFPFFEQ